MRVDTLTYQYKMKIEAETVYQVIESEQKKFFLAKGISEGAFSEGVQVVTNIQTKMDATSVEAQITLLESNSHVVTLQTSYNQGTITQSYQIEALAENLTLIRYSEANRFHQAKNQYNFILVSLLYKFFYNRGIKKRMQYLEEQCKKLENRGRT